MEVKTNLIQYFHHQVSNSCKKENQTYNPIFAKHKEKIEFMKTQLSYPAFKGTGTILIMEYIESSLIIFLF